MSANIVYFVRAHTAKGKINLLHENVQGIENIIVVKGSLAGKAYFFNELFERFKGMAQIEWLKHAEFPLVYEGAILRSSKTAFLDENICAHLKGEKSTIILGDGEGDKSENVAFEAVYDQLNKALQSHFELEKIYISYMDFEKADAIIHDVKEELKKELKIQQGQQVFKRFFGTFTLQGSANAVNELLQPMKKIYHIKGKAGTGKSHFMKELIVLCEQYQLSYEVYYCGFDPSSVDMLIIRSLHICFFDSTFPHEFLPKEGETVIDLYEEAVNPQVEILEREKINKYTKKYRQHIQKAKHILREIGLAVNEGKLSHQDERQIKRQINIVLNELMFKS